MKTVGVREFRDQATSLLASGEVIVIERHGEVIGYYTPLGIRDRAARQEAFDRLNSMLDAVGARTGLTRDEVADELSKPPFH